MKIEIKEIKNRRKGAPCPHCKSRLSYNLEWTGSMWPDFLPANKNAILHCSECSKCKIFFISPKDVPKGAEGITHTTLGEEYTLGSPPLLKVLNKKPSKPQEAIRKFL